MPKNGNDKINYSKVIGRPMSDELNTMFRTRSNDCDIRRHFAKSTSRPVGRKFIASPNVNLYRGRRYCIEYH